MPEDDSPHVEKLVVELRPRYRRGLFKAFVANPVGRAVSAVVAGLAVAAALLLLPFAFYVLIPLFYIASLLVMKQSTRWARHAGWFRGRAEMMGSLKEACQRQMDLGDWIAAEGERDFMYYLTNCASKKEKRKLRTMAENGESV